jgi:hypothetical protein
MATCSPLGHRRSTRLPHTLFAGCLSSAITCWITRWLDGESNLQHDLPVNIGVLFNFSTDFNDFEPPQMPKRFGGCSDRTLNRRFKRRARGAGQFHSFIDMVVCDHFNSFQAWTCRLDTDEPARLLPGRSLVAPFEASVQIIGRADQRQMREGLREIPQMVVAPTQFFRIQPKMVGVAEHLFKD